MSKKNASNALKHSKPRRYRTQNVAEFYAYLHITHIFTHVYNKCANVYTCSVEVCENA